jgi:hypothetical protein
VGCQEQVRLTFSSESKPLDLRRFPRSGHPDMYRLIVAAFVLLMPFAADASATPSCADDAIAHARPLLVFHFGEDDRIAIDDSAQRLAPIENPADPGPTLAVYEVWGYIYKSSYRMRFTYHASSDSGCVLLGQEILEQAKP